MTDIQQFDYEKALDHFEGWPDERKTIVLYAGMRAVYEAIAGTENAGKHMQRFIRPAEELLVANG